MTKLTKLLVWGAISLLIPGCGGGGGGNSTPEITSTAFAVIENNPFAGVVVVRDGNSRLQFSISGGADGASFLFSSAGGELSFRIAPDFEQPADANADNVYEVEVTVSDGGRQSSALIRVTVTNFDESPIFDSTSAVGFPENTAGLLHTLHAVDPEGATVTYAINSVQSPSGGSFIGFGVEASSGRLSLGAPLDFETHDPLRFDGRTYVLQVAASDGTSSESQQLLYLTVTNIPGTVTAGIRIDGVESESASIGMVAAGDVDGDGRRELLVTTIKSRAVLLFGDALGTQLSMPAAITLANLAGRGIALESHCEGCLIVATDAGDVDGDGLFDVLIGVPNANGGNTVGNAGGEVHLLYGATLKAARQNNITTLDLRSAAGQLTVRGGNMGFAIGEALAGGDLDGDGLNDLIFSSPIHPAGEVLIGRVYVLFGKAIGGLPATVNLSQLTGAALAQIKGPATTGRVLAVLPNLQGSGNSALAISSASSMSAGVVYVVGGPALAALNGTEMDLAALPQAGKGIPLVIPPSLRRIGYSLGAAGDIDGDGRAELLVGEGLGEADSRLAHLIYGDTLDVALMEGQLINLDTFAAGEGISFDLGIQTDGLVAVATAAAGDVNGDGIPDFLLGTPGSELLGRSESGITFLLYGAAFQPSAAAPTRYHLQDLNASDGLALVGVNVNTGSGRSLAGLGDLDGDGRSEIAIGSSGATAGIVLSGEVYVLSAQNLATLPRVNETTVDLQDVFGFEPNLPP